MKILYVVSGTGLQGGATKSFFAMADGVAAAGHTIKIVAPDEKGLTVEARKRGWEVMVIPYRFSSLPLFATAKDKLMFIPRLMKNIWQNRLARKPVINFAKEFGPDLIHDNTSVTDVGHYAAKALEIPHIIHVREYGWKDFKLVILGLKKRIRYRKSAVIAITDDLKNHVAKDLPAERKCTIYNGIVKESQIHYQPDKEPVFLYAGRIQRAKGVADLIDAYILYAQEVGKESAFRLVLAGSYKNEPEFHEQLVRKLAKNGLSEKVDWLGEINNVEEYMTTAAATIIPSYWEGFGRVMPEAMASGSLCIARNTGGSAEQLANGRKLTGQEIALPFNDTAQFVDRLKEVDSKFRTGDAYRAGGDFEEIIRNSQRAVMRYYLSENVGKQTVRFYEKILNIFR